MCFSFRRQLGIMRQPSLLNKFMRKIIISDDDIRFLNAQTITVTEMMKMDSKLTFLELKCLLGVNRHSTMPRKIYPLSGHLGAIFRLCSPRIFRSVAYHTQLQRLRHPGFLSNNTAIKLLLPYGFTFLLPLLFHPDFINPHFQ